jgi:hypothetical protein
MGLRQRIVSETYDEKDNKIVDREIINDKPIKKPESIGDLGYNHKEQIDLLQHIQDSFFLLKQPLLYQRHVRSVVPRHKKLVLHHVIFILCIQIISL